MKIPIESGKDHKPGDIIIKFEPQVHCITDEYKSLFCDNCRKKSDRLKKCSKCLQMFYCDKDCQQNDWKSHKYECKVFRHPMWKIKPLDANMRLYLRWWLCYDSDPSFSTRKHPTVLGTEFCFDDIEVNDPFRGNPYKMGKMISIINSIEVFGLEINRDKFIRWFGLTEMSNAFSIPYNNQDVKQSHFEEITGAAVVFQLSRLNHSCAPNSNKTFQGFTMELRANEAIAKGENITLAMIGLQQNKANRQMEMRLLEIPECKCSKCRLNLDQHLDYDKFKALHTSHLSRWMDKSRIDRKYTIDWQFIDLAKMIYGQYHPTVARLMATSFVYFAENSRLASKKTLKLLYDKIEPLVRISHGSDHPYYQSFQKFTKNYINV